MAWTDEKREAVIAEYVETMETQFDTAAERAASTTEVVAQIAEKHGETVNGTRMVLSRAGVYIKKEDTPRASASTGGGTTRINKADALQSLKTTIGSIDPALVEDEIIDRLTGKAAAYFVGVLTAALASE